MVLLHWSWNLLLINAQYYWTKSWEYRNGGDASVAEVLNRLSQRRRAKYSNFVVINFDLAPSFVYHFYPRYKLPTESTLYQILRIILLRNFVAL